MHNYKKGGWIVQYSFWFLVIGCVIFAPVFLSHRSLIMKGDGINGHYPALYFVGRYLKELLHGNVRFFGTELGFGEDIFAAMSWGGLGDILLLPVVFFPEKDTAVAYSFLSIFRMWASGFSFGLFCRYKKVDSLFGITGSIIYAFCRHNIQLGVGWNIFLSAPVMLPLILLAADQAYRNDNKIIKPCLVLAAVSCIQAMSGFYFLYDNMLACAFYIIILLISDIKARKPISYIASRLAKVVFGIIGGIVLALPLLLPSVILFFQSNRTGGVGGDLVEKLFQMPTLRDVFVKTIKLLLPPYWFHDNSLAVPVIFVIVIFYLATSLKRTEYRKYLCIIMLCMLGYFFPAVGTIMNGFSYNTARWMYILYFVLAYVIVKCLPDMLTNRSVIFLACSIILTLTMLIVFLWENKGSGYGVVFKVCAIFCIGVFCAYAIYINKKHMIAFGVLTNVAVLGFLFFAPEYVGGCGSAIELLKYDEVNEMIYSSELYSVAKEITEDDSNYYRVDFNDSVIMAPICFGMNSTYSYFSIYNANTYEIFDKLCVSPGIKGSILLEGLDSRQVLESLFSVKTYTETYEEGTQKLKDNEYYLPQGLFYTKAISYADAENLSYLQRMNVLMDAVVIDNTGYDYAAENVYLGEQIQVPFRVTSATGVDIEGNTWMAGKGGTIELSFDNMLLDNADELYLDIEGLYAEISDIYSDLMVAGRSVRVLPDSSGQPYHFLINISSLASQGVMELRFKQGGVFRYDSMKMILNKNEKFEDLYEHRLSHSMINYSIVDDKIHGKTNENQDGYLMIDLPYSDRWICYVDGEKADIFRVDYSFMAVHLPEGEHEIEFIYKAWPWQG